MKFVNDIFVWFLKRRIENIEEQIHRPFDVQRRMFAELMRDASYTEFGKKHEFSSISNPETFKNRVPVSSYEDLYPYIERVLKGEQNVLWHSDIKWFSKSSGTTNARSKYIPVSNEALEKCHFRGGRDLLTLFIANNPDTRMFDGKSLSIGGSLHANPFNSGTRVGDVSAIMMKNLPGWAELVRTPSLETAMLDSWDLKAERIIQECMYENVTSAAGVPTWLIVLIEKMMDIRKVDSMLDIWPNFEVFLHGAVNFQPYKHLFKTKLFPGNQVKYIESYNASEGYFAIQDDLSLEGELMLMLDYGIFYEFIPMDQWDVEYPQTCTLEEVELAKTYAVVISTNAGLWRYKIGDTVKFTSKNPYRIKITGRTKQFINAFGEELVVENAEDALATACKSCQVALKDFTAGPIYMSDGGKGAHEWIIELESVPLEPQRFVEILDQRLREINSDYDAKRFNNMALELPKVHFVPSGTFYKWLGTKGKLGGQHKVPRLSNDRVLIEEVLALF